MIVICYFSFLTTYSLLSLLPSTFPSHHFTRNVSGKNNQGTDWLTAKSYGLLQFSSIFPSLQKFTQWIPLLDLFFSPGFHDRVLTSSFSAHLLNAGIPRAPSWVSLLFLLSSHPPTPCFLLTSMCPGLPSVAASLPILLGCRSVFPAAYWTLPLWLPGLVSILQWQVIESQLKVVQAGKGN